MLIKSIKSAIVAISALLLFNPFIVYSQEVNDTINNDIRKDNLRKIDGNPLNNALTEYFDDHIQKTYRIFDPEATDIADMTKIPKGESSGGNLTQIMKDFNYRSKMTLLSGGISLNTDYLTGTLSLPLSKLGYANLLFKSSYLPDRTNYYRPSSNTNSSALTGKIYQKTKTISSIRSINAETGFSFKDNTINFSLQNISDSYDNSLQLTELISLPENPEFIVKDILDWQKLNGQFSWIRKWNKSIFTRASLSYNDITRSRDMVSKFVEKEENVAIGTKDDDSFTEQNFNLVSDYIINSNNLLISGIKISDYQSSYQYFINNSNSLIDYNNKGTLCSFNVKYVHGGNKKFEFSPELKVSHFSTTGKLYFEPMLNIRYDLLKRLKIIGQANLNYKFINRLIKNDIESGIWEIWMMAGDEAIPVSKEINLMTGLVYNFKNALLNIEGFYKKSNDIPQFSLNGLEDNLQINLANAVVLSDFREYGVELLAEGEYKKYNYSIGYKISNNINDFHEQVDNTTFIMPDMLLHSLRMSAGYRINKWQFNLAWVYSSGRLIVGPSGVYQMQFVDGTASNFFIIDPDQPEELPAYHRLDLNAGYAFKVGQKAQGNFVVSLFNVYNRKNVWYRKYSYYGEKLIESDILTRGISPNISFLINF